jgi:hypothetical protein
MTDATSNDITLQLSFVLDTSKVLAGFFQDSLPEGY